ncbi:hypothetical protein [Kitasatospora sp. NPDC050463]|uniref:hypothetical protein n=1 Tax=Kitasatospora sp. NPDC050463 TaxID=3155786 RepID=UPI003409365A
MSPDFRLVTAALAVPTLSAGAAALVCWPILDGPLGPQLLISGVILATGVATGLPACFTWLSAAAPGR